MSTDPAPRKKRKRTSGEKWLAAKTVSESSWSLVAALGGAFGSVVALAITYMVAYAIATRLVGFRPPLVSTISWTILGLLFVVNAIFDREALESVSIPGPGDRRPISLHLPVMAATRMGMLGAPGGLLIHGLLDPRSFLRIMSSIFLAGPRLVTFSFRMVARARRLRRLDVPVCGPIVSLLLAEDSRVSLAKIADKFPHVDLAAIVSQLREIDGVLVLMSEPPGLTLSTDLKHEYREWSQRGREARGPG